MFNDDCRMTAVISGTRNIYVQACNNGLDYIQANNQIRKLFVCFANVITLIIF
jgi:hypothetical protein